MTDDEKKLVEQLKKKYYQSSKADNLKLAALIERFDREVEHCNDYVAASNEELVGLQSELTAVKAENKELKRLAVFQCEFNSHCDYQACDGEDCLTLIKKTYKDRLAHGGQAEE